MSERVSDLAAGDVRGQLTCSITMATGDATTVTITAMNWIEQEGRELRKAA